MNKSNTIAIEKNLIDRRELLSTAGAGALVLGSGISAGVFANATSAKAHAARSDLADWHFCTDYHSRLGAELYKIDQETAFDPETKSKLFRKASCPKCGTAIGPANV